MQGLFKGTATEAMVLGPQIFELCSSSNTFCSRPTEMTKIPVHDLSHAGVKGSVTCVMQE